MRDVTLLFPVRRDAAGRISHICLAIKKRGFGAGKWNGTGGKVAPGESIREAAIREAHEEICVMVRELRQAALLDFHFPHNPDWDQRGHVYLAESWDGEPAESEEMRPQWFAVADIPYAGMWSDDSHWLPQVLAGDMVRGAFSFGPADETLDMRVEPCDSSFEWPE